jgi:UDP-N-acetylglucosamine acyltransferase
MAIEIHPTALVDEGASIGEGAFIGPYCVVGKGAKVGNGTRLIAHVVLDGRVEIGEGCSLHPFVSIGQPPQDLKYRGEDTLVRIGDYNVIREGVTIHRASVGGKMETAIGDHNFIMTCSHVAHDCKVGSHVIMASYAALSGHVTVEDYVVMGGMAGVQQHTRIGAFAMVGGMSRIVQDVPPYAIVSGAEKTRLYGLNRVGLKRHGFSEETINELKRAFNILFREKLSRREALKKVQEELPYTEEIGRLVEFVKASKKLVSRMGAEAD